MQVLCVDISQAFAQTSTVERPDRFLIEPPDCLMMHWKGIANANPTSNRSPNEFVLLMAKPLYGLRDNPLMWFVSLCTCLRKFGYRQCRMDICMFVFVLNEVPDTFILSYVDDLMVCYCDNDASDRFLIAIRSFNIGEPEFLASESEIQFLGLDIRREKDLTISLSRKNICAQSERDPKY